MVDTRFGYALANGTVGVYDRTSRYWRIKVCIQFASNFNLLRCVCFECLALLFGTALIVGPVGYNMMLHVF